MNIMLHNKGDKYIYHLSSCKIQQNGAEHLEIQSLLLYYPISASYNTCHWLEVDEPYVLVPLLLGSPCCSQELDLKS